MAAATVLGDRSNVVLLWHDHSSRCVVKQYGPKSANRRTAKYAILWRLGWPVPIEYRSPAARRTYEQRSLQIWRAYGFRAPHEVPVPEAANAEGLVLAEQYLEGPTLEERLRDNAVPLEKKLREIAEVFSEMSDRHRVAISRGQRELIHLDSNVRNVVLTPDGPTRIDFETGRPFESVVKAAAREVQKIVLEIVDRLGSETLDETVRLLCQHYTETRVLKKIVNRTLYRVAMPLHRYHDRRRKRRRPQTVSKFDLAEAVQQRLKLPRP